MGKIRAWYALPVESWTHVYLAQVFLTKYTPFTQPLSPYSARYEHVTTKSQTLSTVILRSYPADSIIRRLNKKETKTWLPKATTKGHQQGLRRKTPPSRAPHGYVCTTKRRDIPKHTSTPKRNCRLKQNDERTGKGHKKPKKNFPGPKKSKKNSTLARVNLPARISQTRSQKQGLKRRYKSTANNQSHPRLPV